MSTNWKDKPGFFFFTTCLTMGVLLIAALYFTQSPPAKYHATFSFTAVLPLWVPWAGALGGCTISLVGIVRHGRHWDPSYAYWHLARPLLGGVCGTIGVLIVVLVLKSVAATPPTSAGGAAPPTDVAYDRAGVAVLAVLAFVIGYREQTFRTLIRRVADVILGPGDAGPAAIVAFVPALLELHATGTNAVTGTVHLFNGSPSALVLGATAVIVEPADQGFSAELESEGPLGGNEARGITVTWTPPSAGAAATAVLTATLGGYTARVQLRGSSDPDGAEGGGEGEAAAEQPPAPAAPPDDDLPRDLPGDLPPEDVPPLDPPPEVASPGAPAPEDLPPAGPPA